MVCVLAGAFCWITGKEEKSGTEIVLFCWAFTKKGTSIYAIYQVAEGETIENSLSVTLPAGTNVKGISVIGGPQKVKFTSAGGNVVLSTTDKSIVKQTEALVFKIVTE
jgi:hypothetical protein